jgi:hypothetical protein
MNNWEVLLPTNRNNSNRIAIDYNKQLVRLNFSTSNTSEDDINVVSLANKITANIENLKWFPKQFVMKGCILAQEDGKLVADLINNSKTRRFKILEDEL